MPSCVLRHCKSCSQTQKQKDGISFHRLPTDYVLREKWISIIRKSRQDKDWLPSKFCVVCSLHFKEEDVYLTKKGRRLIKKKSKPTLDLSALQQPLESSSSVITGALKYPVAVEDQPGTSNVLSTNQPGNPIKCDSVEPEIGDSDLDSIIFDTPQITQLKKDLRKHQLLRKVSKRKVKTLHEKVRRLKKRNSALQNIIKDLKNKHFINRNSRKFYWKGNHFYRSSR